MTLELELTEVRRLKKATADDHRTASRVIKFGMGLVGALAAGACQFIVVADPYMPWVRAIGLLGAILAFFAAIWTGIADRHASESLDLADVALSKAQRAEMENDKNRRATRAAFDAVRDEHLHQRQLLALTSMLREGVERAIGRFPCEDLHKDIHSLTRGILRTLLACLRCEAGERWTLTIYREQSGVLAAIAAFTVDREEGEVKAREWPIGEGYAGAAFARDREIILPDAQAPQVLAMLNVPKERTKLQDGSKYRSVAAVPIRVAGLEPPWGVVIATSDRLARFDSGEAGAGAVGAQAVRMLSGMLALLVAADIKCAAIAAPQTKC